MSENDRFDKQMDKEEKCVTNNKTGGCDGIVEELLKYGGSGTVFAGAAVFYYLA